MNKTSLALLFLLIPLPHVLVVSPTGVLTSPIQALVLSFLISASALMMIFGKISLSAPKILIPLSLFTVLLPLTLLGKPFTLLLSDGLCLSKSYQEW